ncbi:MAG: TRAP transporter substrate-binding protein [Rhodobacteraceae bacterium]|nr:TRAP transporter substrate-binding protein [Paracoccaceae bacterium]
MRTRLYAAVAGVMLAAGWAGGADAQITLRVADVQANTAYETGLRSFADKVAAYTEGRVVVQVTMGTALGSEAEIVRQVRQGTLDMVQVGLSGYDKFQLFYIPFLFDNDRLMDFTRSDIAEGWKQAVLDDWGVHLLEYVYFGPRQITANKPVLTPEDLRGVKIRVPQFPTMVEAFQNLGANAVALPVGELYVSLQTGAIDAQENPLNFIVGASIFEVQSDLTLTNHVQAPRFMFINAASLGRLTAADQDAVRRAAREAAEQEMAELRASEAEYLRLLQEKGMKVHETDSARFAALVRDVGRAEAEQLWGPGVLDRIRADYGPKD